jgi:hypothetical protein
MWIESRMLWTSLFTIYGNWMQILYQNQLLNVPQWKLTSDALTFLVELSSAACCKSVLSKIRGYHRSMPMCMVFTFSGNYWIGEGNTINKFIYISSLLLNASCRLIKSLKRYGSSICFEYLLVQRCNWR